MQMKKRKLESPTDESQGSTKEGMPLALSEPSAQKDLVPDPSSLTLPRFVTASLNWPAGDRQSSADGKTELITPTTSEVESVAERAKCDDQGLSEEVDTSRIPSRVTRICLSTSCAESLLRLTVQTRDYDGDRYALFWSSDTGELLGEIEDNIYTEGAQGHPYFTASICFDKELWDALTLAPELPTSSLAHGSAVELMLAVAVGMSERLIDHHFQENDCIALRADAIWACRQGTRFEILPKEIVDMMASFDDPPFLAPAHWWKMSENREQNGTELALAWVNSVNPGEEKMASRRDVRKERRRRPGEGCRPSRYHHRKPAGGTGICGVFSLNAARKNNLTKDILTTTSYIHTYLLNDSIDGMSYVGNAAASPIRCDADAEFSMTLLRSAAHDKRLPKEKKIQSPSGLPTRRTAAASSAGQALDTRQLWKLVSAGELVQKTLAACWMLKPAEAGTFFVKQVWVHPERPVARAGADDFRQLRDAGQSIGGKRIPRGSSSHMSSQHTGGEREESEDGDGNQAHV
ncbi:hypothetical protein BDK51DRAFT_45560 [Blyttiomyces helicus]|uniref:Uncharacterized protein n=1 Tax=Blyttiomyces helicus TaxID=388810 RepID=A0A4P9WI49_9FUNG|nr:hypothetical protein BDK51DRAFT_45560 [Blyttiomyces helicus]|eukprot:RKO91543.1 hypothetical protein BDK51DRAFT_45560 [Blyttiomyces helicus]